MWNFWDALRSWMNICKSEAIQLFVIINQGGYNNMGFYFWDNSFYKDTILTVIFNVHVFFMYHKHAFSTNNYFILYLIYIDLNSSQQKSWNFSSSLQFQIQPRVDMAKVKRPSKNQWECVVHPNMRTLECISKKLRSFSSFANFSQLLKRVQLLTSAALLSKVTSSFSFNYHSLTITPWIRSELF